MKLFFCYETFTTPRHEHLCREVGRLTGSNWVPTLITDDGTAIDGSKKNIAWAKANPAGTTA